MACCHGTQSCHTYHTLSIMTFRARASLKMGSTICMFQVQQPAQKDNTMKTTGPQIYNDKSSHCVLLICRASHPWEVPQKNLMCDPRTPTSKQDHKPAMALLRHSSVVEQYKWKHQVVLRKTQCNTDVLASGAGWSGITGNPKFINRYIENC